MPVPNDAVAARQLLIELNTLLESVRTEVNKPENIIKDHYRHPKRIAGWGTTVVALIFIITLWSELMKALGPTTPDNSDGNAAAISLILIGSILPGLGAELWITSQEHNRVTHLHHLSANNLQEVLRVTALMQQHNELSAINRDSSVKNFFVATQILQHQLEQVVLTQFVRVRIEETNRLAYMPQAFAEPNPRQPQGLLAAAPASPAVVIEMQELRNNAIQVRQS